MIRLMRGQVVIREIDTKQSDWLWTPTSKPQDVHTHRGIVVAHGPPSLNCVTDSMGRCTSLTCLHAEVQLGFSVGDVVQYHFSGHHQSAHTRCWEDGKDATWVPQRDVDAVIEEAGRG